MLFGVIKFKTKDRTQKSVRQDEIKSPYLQPLISSISKIYLAIVNKTDRKRY